MGREHADERDAGARDGAARDCQPEGEGAGRSDDPPVVEGGVHAVVRQKGREPSRVI